ncbi:hypothetical protein Xmau_02725 [Xenorhabdus mauleonii]|uniref:Uncharacterized protein n=1 Tax=Xenorhabdus mauleonii TaxID=351675 RepID=A0A1I3I7M8_9GAMM|nr:hypothetical protein Xmau_02725 [Xenorhabdus mauleonii]SFI43867.1 hypothetical protein SAMN05421680_101223 [Xenorhabdus mauleonii]
MPIIAFNSINPLLFSDVTPRRSIKKCEKVTAFIKKIEIKIACLFWVHCVNHLFRYQKNICLRIVNNAVINRAITSSPKKMR